MLDIMVPEQLGLTTGRMAGPQEVADAVALPTSPCSANVTAAELAIGSGALKHV
ncbi:hypothetical protein HCN51_36445 [Nonomuraea sp. FMUSA5-5]|uniref:Uncharacterized protein n=1 Tax=Nonomuraea composti TaxID=2720023 RepID=A0ABX1BE90_9ACTN|nr:hypothetical protein [Nonomuraea sp. FMUSA5-5]NJP94865.1 hypothetical protein [Nonomuraea sp. FMUSA5-5]